MTQKPARSLTKDKRHILVTSALPYANGPIHIGHMVEYIQTDIWVRFQKMRNNCCIYVCADDAHGTPIMLKARQEGIEPETLIAQVTKEHQADFADFRVDFDSCAGPIGQDCYGTHKFLRGQEAIGSDPDCVDELIWTPSKRIAFNAP